MTCDYSHVYFEGKQIDEVVLHACHGSKIQLFYELFKILFPAIFFSIISIFLYIGDVFGGNILSMILGIIFLISLFSVGYKIFRYKQNYLYITSKRIIFHGLNGWFGDYVKKIHYENIRNINYFTENFIGKIFKYGTLEIQSSHGGLGDITVYHVESGKNLTHYLDKVISLSSVERQNFACFDPNYFKKQ